MRLDDQDRLLLAEIQEDAHRSQSQLGERASLSTAAVNRRLRALSDEGVIEGYVAKINPRAVGLPLTVIVEVKLESERADYLQAVQKGFLACPLVQQCYYVTGECDFVLVVLVPDMERYVQLTHELFHNDKNVKAFKTLVVMDRVKTGMHVPLTP